MSEPQDLRGPVLLAALALLALDALVVFCLAGGIAPAAARAPRVAPAAALAASAFARSLHARPLAPPQPRAQAQADDRSSR